MVGRLAPVVRVLPTPALAAQAAGVRLLQLADAAIRERGRFVLALSGGATPEALYASLGTRRIGSVGWEFFLCDERLVPPQDSRSNIGQVRRLWLGPASVPEASVHPVDTSVPAEEAARRYGAALRQFFGPSPGPTFDLVLLGIGPDGHTASLFPGSSTLEVRDLWAVAEPSPGLPPVVPRVTMTLEALGRARAAVFLVTGAEKRAAVAAILGRPGAAKEPVLPAKRVATVAAVEWFLDLEAARELPGPY